MANRFHALERGRASLFLLVGIVLVAAVVVAAVVVVKGLSRIQSVKVPVHMQGPKPDTELAGFRASLQRRLDKLERRYDKHRPGVSRPFSGPRVRKRTRSTRRCAACSTTCSRAANRPGRFRKPTQESQLEGRQGETTDKHR
jgi:hypothetical protein